MAWSAIGYDENTGMVRWYQNGQEQYMPAGQDPNQVSSFTNEFVPDQNRINSRGGVTLGELLSPNYFGQIPGGKSIDENDVEGSFRNAFGTDIRTAIADRAPGWNMPSGPVTADTLRNSFVPASYMEAIRNRGDSLGGLPLLAPAIGGIVGAAGGIDFSSLLGGDASAGAVEAGADAAAGNGWGVDNLAGGSVADGGAMDMYGSYAQPGNPSAGTIFSGASSSPSWLSSLGNDWTKLLGPASNIIGGLMGKSAAETAANIQSGATDRAINAQTAATMAGIDEIRRQNMQARQDSLPWLKTGTEAIGTLGNLTGVGGDSLNSPLLRKFTVQDFYNDPVTALSMQFGMDQGQRGIENRQRSMGMLNSGAALKELTRYGTDYAGQQAGASRERFIGDQTNAFNKLAGLSGIGQTAAQSITGSGNNAAQSIAGMGQSSGNTTASLMSGLGNARGAASIAGSNAMGNAFNSIGNWYTQNRLLDSLGIK